MPLTPPQPAQVRVPADDDTPWGAIVLVAVDSLGIGAASATQVTRMRRRRTASALS